MRRAQAEVRDGSTLYGETPFGWRLSNDRTRLVVDSNEQRLLALVRHMHGAERMTMRAIVALLAEAGVVNRRGNRFSVSGVWEMIHERKERPSEAGRR